MMAVGLHLNNLTVFTSNMSFVIAQWSRWYYTLTIKHQFKDFFTGMLVAIVATPVL